MMRKANQYIVAAALAGSVALGGVAGFHGLPAADPHASRVAGVGILPDTIPTPTAPVRPTP